MPLSCVAKGKSEVKIGLCSRFQWIVETGQRANTRTHVSCGNMVGVSRLGQARWRSYWVSAIIDAHCDVVGSIRYQLRSWSLQPRQMSLPSKYVHYVGWTLPELRLRLLRCRYSSGQNLVYVRIYCFGFGFGFGSLHRSKSSRPLGAVGQACSVWNKTSEPCTRLICSFNPAITPFPSVWSMWERAG